MSLRALLAAAASRGASLSGPYTRLDLTDLSRFSGLGAARGGLASRAVLLRTQSQIGAAQGPGVAEGVAAHGLGAGEALPGKPASRRIQGRVLAEDPDYPSAAVIRHVAGLIFNSPDLSEDRD